MKFIKKMMIAVVCIVLAAGLAACGAKAEEKQTEERQPDEKQPKEKPSEGKEAQDVQTVRIGVMYSADIIPLAVIKEQGIDKEHGFTLDMQVFTSAPERDAALQAGELDGVFTDYIGVCIYQNAGIDVKITGVTDGDYSLVAGKDSGLENLSQCEGKSIAISENTLIEYTLDYLLEQEGYPSDYLKKEIVPKITERVELLNAGSIDMGILPEPFGTLAKAEGAVLLGSANEKGLYPAVSAFLDSAITEKNEGIKGLYEAYAQACTYVNETPIEQLENIIIREAGFPESLRGKIQLPVYRENMLPSKEELEKAINWSSAKGLCSQSLTPEDLLGEL